MEVASSREDAWIETLQEERSCYAPEVASSREDAWIETAMKIFKLGSGWSRPPARTRGLKQNHWEPMYNRVVASSREDAWIET